MVMIKNEVLSAIIKEQQIILDDIKKTINVYETTADIDEDNTLDPEDYSHQTEAKEMQLRFQEKLKEEQAILDFLETHKNRVIHTVESGALIETEAHYIFIGVSVRSTNVNNKDALSVSEKAPIVNSLKGKEVGEKIVIGDKEYTILSIS